MKNCCIILNIVGGLIWSYAFVRILSQISYVFAILPFLYFLTAFLLVKNNRIGLYLNVLTSLGFGAPIILKDKEK